MKMLRAVAAAALILGMGGSLAVPAAEIDRQTAHRLNQLSRETKVNADDLRAAVEAAEFQPKIIELITKPWEKKPWHAYRKLFITDKRIQEGARFLRDNLKILEKAEKDFGVEKEVIVAILGVETFYGDKMGTWKLVDALYTLGFHYPKRSQYFSKEFANYVKLAHSQGWGITERSGSYAGAMGMAQFMPSSYLGYAVDFNHDGKKDLFYSRADAVGSIANYFKKSGWIHGRSVAYPASVSRKSSVAGLLGGKLTPNTTIGELRKRGVEILAPRGAVHDADRVKLLELDGEEGKVYYVIYPNFVSITRYNTSPLYAMAVHDLSQEIRREIQGGPGHAESRPGSHDAHDRRVPVQEESYDSRRDRPRR